MPQVKCKICNKEFYVKPNHLKLGWGKYCSRKCASLSRRKGQYVICDICGKKIWKMPKDIRGSKSGKFFCGKSCQTKWRNGVYSGENHYLWQGGECVYREKLIKSGRKIVCKKCGLTDKRVIIAHHIDKNRKNTNLSNLVWLCRNCHHLAHNHNEDF